MSIKLPLWLRVKRIAFNLVAPRDACCAFCGKDAPKDLHCVCTTCAAKLPQRPVLLSSIEGIEKHAAAFYFEEPVRSLIHRLKYSNGRYLARFCAFAMADALRCLPLPPDAAFVAVPLHPKRKRERTFNQSEELCLELYSITGREWLRKALVRNRITRHQTHLSAAERKVNLLGAFTADRMVSGRSIVLVDDVATTGSTLRECANALHAAGAARVYAIVLASEHSPSILTAVESPVYKQIK